MIKRCAHRQLEPVAGRAQALRFGHPAGLKLQPRQGVRRHHVDALCHRQAAGICRNEESADGPRAGFGAGCNSLSNRQQGSFLREHAGCALALSPSALNRRVSSMASSMASCVPEPMAKWAVCTASPISTTGLLPLTWNQPCGRRQYKPFAWF